jgi:hypothetical protein
MITWIPVSQKPCESAWYVVTIQRPGEKPDHGKCFYSTYEGMWGSEYITAWLDVQLPPPYDPEKTQTRSTNYITIAPGIRVPEVIQPDELRLFKQHAYEEL